MTDSPASGAAGPAGVLRSPPAGRMVFVGVAWGACFVAIEWGLRDAPPLWFAALRAIVAGVVLLPVARARPRPRGTREWASVVLLGVVNVTVVFAAMFTGAAGLAAGTASVLANAQPLLIVLPAWWWFGERPSARTTVALGAAFAGLLVVAFPGGGGTGAGLSLLAAAAVTAGTLLARRLVPLDVVTVAAWHLLLGGLVLSGLAAAVEGAPAIAWTPRFTVSLALLAVVGTAATTVIWFHVVRRSRMDVVTAWTFLTPVSGIALSFLAFGERPDVWTAVGLVAVLAALWTVLRPRRTADAERSRGRVP